jgi:hypothetical protein
LTAEEASKVTTYGELPEGAKFKFVGLGKDMYFWYGEVYRKTRHGPRPKRTAPALPEDKVLPV